MKLEDIYKALEEREKDGKDLVAGLKGHLKKLNDESASQRVELNRLKGLEVEVEKLKAIKEKLDSNGIEDIDSFLEKAKGDSGKKTELEKSIELLNKKLDLMEKAKAEEEKKRQLAEEEKIKLGIRTKLSTGVSQAFGKLGETLLTEKINSGKLQNVDGKIIYETDDGIYEDDAIVEILKAEYPDNVIKRGGGFDGRTKHDGAGGQTSDVDELLKLDRTELFRRAHEKS